MSSPKEGIESCPLSPSLSSSLKSQAQKRELKVDATIALDVNATIQAQKRELKEHVMKEYGVY